MKKKIIWSAIIILIILASLKAGFALDMCEDKIEISQNCTLLTPIVKDCSVFDYEIYNISGDLVETDNLTILTTDIYYLNFTVGAGDYIVKLCDGTTRELRVTSEDSEKMIIAALIILPVILGLFLLLGSFFLSEDHTPLKIFMFLLSMVTVWVSLHFGMVSIVEFYDFPEMQNLIGTTTFWFSSLFVVMVTYFLIYLVYKITEKIGKEKEERLNY